MQVRLLGQVEVVAGDGDAEPLAVGGPTQRRVLAALALRRNEVVSVPHLVDVIWPDGDPPDRADHNVRTYVHRLRMVLDGEGERIETVGSGYRLRLDADELDAARFERLTQVTPRLAETGDVVAALDAATEAERLWHGAPLEEFRHEPWAAPDAVRLSEARAELRTERAELLIEAGRAGAAIEALDALASEEPLRERPRALLMRALYESGRQAEALRAFQDFRRLLIDEIGVEPSADLVTLDRAIASGTMPTLDEPTRTVGGYELHERIGEGAFAVVRRATQTALGREVAVKIVRAELANRPEFIRRFEAEAQMVARIEHPNVVPLYDYWREPDRAFLVMRWMTGGSLETRLDDGPWTLDATVELVEQVASALDAAHRAGVVHRDVKPGNILFDDAGRAYLGDFGIALAAEERSRPEAALSEGSPVFASPEQLRREPAGPETDVHALAIVAFTLLTGRTPFADAPDEPTLLQRQLHDPIPPAGALRSDLPAQVDEVLAIATAKQAADRYPSAPALAAAFRAAASTTDETTVATVGLRPRANPYKGLRAFAETDAADFYGRERLVDELIDHLAQPDACLLALVGPSGSGKSSVVRAGVVPALRAGRVPGSSSWFTTTMIPGSRPFEALETALLRIAVNPPAALLDQLRDGDRGILRGVRRIVPDDDAVVAIVIDQFEEVFTGAVPDAARDQFLRALVAAVTEPGSPVRVLLTLRADFYDRPLRHSEFAPLLKRHAVAVTPLAPDELEHAIVAPAATVGVGFEPGLVAEIIADVNHEPGALPLLQYALTQVFDDTDGDMVTVDAYRTIGGLTGALGQRAEGLWQAAGTDGRQAARRLFGRLVTLGEGTEDTRRRVHLTELGDDDATRAVIDRYGSARLLTFDRDPATREPTCEVAHEALIREWSRMRVWLDDDRDTLRIHRHLTIAAEGWRAQGRDPGELYRGGRLDTATSWAAEHRTDLNPVEGDFLDASIAAHEAEQAAERAHLEQQARSNRRLRVLAAVASVIALVAAAAGVFALQQRSRADDEASEARALAARADRERASADVARATADANAEEAATRTAEAVAERARADESAAEAERQAAEARGAEVEQDIGRVRATAFEVVDRDLRLGLLLGAEAYQMNPSRASESALHRLLADTDGIVGTSAAANIGRLWVDDDGDTAVTQRARSIEVWDLDTLEIVSTLDRPTSTASRVDVSFITGLVVVTDETGTDLVDLRSNEVAELFPEQVVALAFSPVDGSLAVSFGNRFEIWDVSTPSRPEQVTNRPWSVEQIASTPSGTGWLTVAEGQLQFRALDEVAPRWSIPATPFFLKPLFSDDGGLLVYATRDATGLHEVRAVSMADGSQIGRSAPAGEGIITDLAWLDEDRLQVVAAAISDDLSAFDLAAGTEFDAPFDNQGTWELEYIASPPRIVAAGNNGLTVRLVGGVTSPLERRAPLLPEQTKVLGGDVTPRYVVSRDGTKMLVSVAAFPEWEPIVSYDLTVDPPDLRVTDLDGIVFGANGHTLLVNDTMVMIDEELEPIGQPVPTPPDARDFTVSPDGRFFAVSTPTGRVELYRSTGERIGGDIRVPGGTSRPGNGSAISFSEDGSLMAVYQAFGSTAWAVWDTEAGEVVHVGRTDDVIRPHWSGSRLYAERRTVDFVQVQLDPITFEPTGERLVGHTGVRCTIVEDGVGMLLATQAADGTVRAWDQQTGIQVGAPIPSTGCNPQWAAHGTLLVTGHPGHVSIWNYDTDTWVDIACEVAGRNLTPEEWAEFGPRTRKYRPTCPQFSTK